MAFDLSAKRELNKGFGDALSVAVELAVTPAIFAFLGWRLDEWLGTTPLFLLVFFLFTFTYVAWREYTKYKLRMDAAPAGAPRPRSAEGEAVTAADRHAPVPDGSRGGARARLRHAQARRLVRPAGPARRQHDLGRRGRRLGRAGHRRRQRSTSSSPPSRLSWAAKISLTAIMAVALGGFALRMGLVVAVLFGVRDAGWVNMTALAILILVTHLGLLFWELRYVSASLAFPGLKPTTDKEAVA